jgi:hypothetical protein
MTLSSEQAAQALLDLETAGRLSGRLYRYQRSAPMLIVWGVIWLIGFGLSDFFPARINLIWLVLDVVGISACIYLDRASPASDCKDASWRWLASIFSILAFYILVQLVLQPVTESQAAVLMALLVALFYVLGGLWIGARLALAGVVLAALTLIGFFMLSAHFNLWMAVVGGGALILAGLWLRRV